MITIPWLAGFASVRAPMSADTPSPVFGSPLAWLVGVGVASAKKGNGAEFRRKAAAQVSDSAEHNAGVDALEGAPGAPLAEDAFRSLLAIERARAERAGRSLRLVAVSVGGGSRQAAAMTPAVAARVFAGLVETMRETDLVGWYREGRVAAAVLVDRAGAQGGEAGAVVLRRVRDVLRERLPARAARGLRLRLVRVREAAKSR